MKKIIIILAAVLLFWTACEKDFLEENPKSFFAPENTFVNTKGFETALTGLMWIVRYEFDDKVTQVLWGGTDMCRRGNTSSGFRPIELLQEYTEDWSTSKQIWDRSYEIIGNANEILAHINDEGVDWALPEDKTRIEAQAKFVRAYYYEYLLTLWGDLPFITETAKPFKLDFTRTPVATIHDFIIKELQDAIPNLPDEVAPEKDGTPNKGAAQYLLAQVYLHVGRNSDAETTANAIISSGTYELMTERFGSKQDKPGDAFSDMYLENNQNRTSGNLESIWCLQHQYKVLGGNEFEKYNELSFNKRIWVPRYADVRGMLLCDSLGGRGRARWAPCNWLLDSYEPQDMRNSRYNIRRDYYYNNPDPKYDTLYGKKVEITDAMLLRSMYPTTTKWYFGKTADDPAYAPMDKELMVYRLAGVYLMLAEAQFKQNRPDDAAESLNVIRSRANASTVTGADVDMDYILDEYARELLAEYPYRRYTLLRTGTLANRIQMHRPEVWANFQVGRDELWPIPQLVIDANLDAVIEQNPGYH